MTFISNILTFLTPSKFYFTEEDTSTIINQIKLHRENITNVWTKYIMFSTSDCVKSVSKGDVLSDKKQIMECAYGKFILPATCKSNRNIFYINKQLKEIQKCEYYSTAYQSFNNLEKVQITSKENSATINKTKPTEQECLNVKYNLHTNINFY